MLCFLVPSTNLLTYLPVLSTFPQMGKGQVVLYVVRPHYVDKKVVVIKKVFSLIGKEKKALQQIDQLLS